MQQTSFYQDWIGLSARLGLPKGFENNPPNEQMRLLAACGADPGSKEDFLRLGPR